MRSAVQSCLRRSTAVTCSVWCRSAGRHRRRSCTGCFACTAHPRDARAPAHFGRFHPGSSGRRIPGSSGNANRPAPSRRSSTSSATSPDFPPERDDAPSFPPCRRSFALPSPLAVHRAVAPRWNPYRRASSDHHGRSASPRAPVACNTGSRRDSREEAAGHRARWRPSTVFVPAAPVDVDTLRSAMKCVFHDLTDRPRVSRGEGGLTWRVPSRRLLKRVGPGGDGRSPRACC